MLLAVVHKNKLSNKSSYLRVIYSTLMLYTLVNAEYESSSDDLTYSCIMFITVSVSFCSKKMKFSVSILR